LIAITGHGQEEECRRCQEAGFDHHRVKPVEPHVSQSVLASQILTLHNAEGTATGQKTYNKKPL
jgi:hypothetical protein